MCDNEMSFIMMPQLSIVKTRFAKASLRARCARHRSETLPVGFPMIPWVTQLPHSCMGYSASQWLRGSSSFQRNVTGRQAEVHTAWESIPRQSAGCFVSLITGRHTGGASPQSRCTGLLAKYLAFSALLPSDRVGRQAVPIYGSPRHHTASELHILRIFADRSYIFQRFVHRIQVGNLPKGGEFAQT